MKQFSTLENELAMIINLLTEMVETKYLSQEEMDTILSKYCYEIYDNPQEVSDEVITNLVRYSQGLEVLKTSKSTPQTVLIN